MNPIVLASSPLVGSGAMLGVAVPRSMFSLPIPAPDFDGPCGFVGFGDGYADDAAEAERRGWRVTVIAGAHHLWPLVEPDAVAEALVDLVDRLVA